MTSNWGRSPMQLPQRRASPARPTPAWAKEAAADVAVADRWASRTTQLASEAARCRAACFRAVRQSSRFSSTVTTPVTTGRYLRIGTQERPSR